VASIERIARVAESELRGRAKKRLSSTLKVRPQCTNDPQPNNRLADRLKQVLGE